jgi:hypothetical protein
MVYGINMGFSSSSSGKVYRLKRPIFGWAMNTPGSLGGIYEKPQ